MTVTGLSESTKRDFSIFLVYLLLAQTHSNVRFNIAPPRAGVQETLRHIDGRHFLAIEKLPVIIENEVKFNYYFEANVESAISSFDTSQDVTWNELLLLSNSNSLDEQDEQQKSPLRSAVPPNSRGQLGDDTAFTKLEAMLRDLMKFAPERNGLPQSAKKVRELDGTGRTDLGLNETGERSKDLNQFELLSPEAKAQLHDTGLNGFSRKQISALIESTQIILRPLWYDQVSAADFVESNMLIRKADPLMAAAASHYAGSAGASGAFDGACASKTDETNFLAGIDQWDSDYDLSDADGFNGKPLAYGNYSDANANQLHYDATDRDASPACTDQVNQSPDELVDILDDSNENVEPLGTRLTNEGGNRFGSASNNWQASPAGYREPKDQPMSREYLLAYEPGAASSGWRVRSDELEDTAGEPNYHDSSEMATVNEFGSSDDNLLTILNDIEQSVNELNELNGESEHLRFETAAYAFVGAPVRRASDESGVRSLSNEDEEEEQLEVEYDPDLNVFNEVTAHPEYAEIVNWPNADYLPSASTSTGYPRLSALPRQAGLRNTFEETQEEECELEESEEDEPDVSYADDASLYTVPKSRAQRRASNYMRSRNHLTTSDATESVGSWNDQEPSEHSYAHSDTNSRATSSAQLGSHALSNANLPFGDDEIVHSSFAHFESMLTDPRLSASDVQTMKDIRRRGKNKIAAMNCRRRKQQRVDTLIDERVELNRQNKALEARLARLREQARAYDARLERAMRQHQSNGRAVAVRA